MMRATARLKALLLLMWFSFACASLQAAARIEARYTIAAGWHEWYELKVDPEESKNLMVCGNAWDPFRNALYGFVAVSSDGGRSWRKTLEDRATAWVSEQSCAFGRKDSAYFVSEASLVIDGNSHHEEGATHLFLSTDGGQHWNKTAVTGWADYSTSAVSSSSAELITLFNHGSSEPGRGWGKTVGALIFSIDGKQVRGTFSDPEMKEEAYLGIFPSQATAVRDGSVVALYGGLRKLREGAQYDLGLQRIRPGATPKASYSVIATTTPQCFTIDGHALAYDSKDDQLIVVYADASSQGCRLMLASSVNQGKTWSTRPLANSPVTSQWGFAHLAAAVAADGSIGLLWEDSGTWFFSVVRDLALNRQPLKLSSRPRGVVPTNDSLSTFIRQPQGLGSADHWPPVATINVRSSPGEVMRSVGLISVGNRFQAVVPVIQDGHERLEIVQIVNDGGSVPLSSKAASLEDDQRDVTAQIALLTGHAQTFDPSTGTLSVDLRLANRGTRPLRIPIRIKARELSSEAGNLTIENADNGLKGVGAIWDISRTITGDELAPGDAAYNVFHLKFHVDLKKNAIPTEQLIDCKVSVLARSGESIR